MTRPVTHTLDAPGATIHYDVRPGTGDAPPLLMIGSPMDARGFAALAGQFGDRTVVTYDPRGVNRSTRTERGECTPQQHADDLYRVIQAVGGGPVDVFASSGGAVNALALVAAHPGAVRTLVAHEPPLASLLPDRDRILSAMAAVGDAYQRDGLGAGMARFITLTMLQGEVPADFADLPPADPGMFGLPTGDDGSRDDPLLAQNLMTCPSYRPDIEALRAAPTRIVAGVGEQSVGQVARRGAEALADRLGTAAVTFPGHHGGFVGDGFGMPGDPEGFATVLRKVLDSDS
jgi:pimeloyl-ACP methyl ester carboxylesterase